MKIVEELQEAIQTNIDRDKQYKDSYKLHGAVLAILFPNGIVPKTAKEWERFTFLNMVVVKLVRYATSMEAGVPHYDSAHDLGIYAMMLCHLDKQEEKIFSAPESEEYACDSCGYPAKFFPEEGLWRHAQIHGEFQICNRRGLPIGVKKIL